MLKSWIHNTGAIDCDEASYLDHTSDLVAIVPKIRPPISRWIRYWKRKLRFDMFWAVYLRKQYGDSGDTARSKESEFNSFTNFGIILVGLAMLLAPIWWLEYVPDSVPRLRIITGFICGFSLILTLGTISRPFEVVAATAAYAAVLMVFMQIDNKTTR
jgi:hypothetical protein